MADRGEQQRLFHFRQPLKSVEFNRIFSKTLPAGIYEGGTMSRVSNLILTVDPLSVIIEDDLGKDVAVRIRTVQPVNLTIDPVPSQPLVVLRYEWKEDVDNYMEFVQVSETIKEDSAINRHVRDLIIGKIVFEGTNIAPTNSFDYTRASYSFANPQRDHLLPLLTVKTPVGVENARKVYVEGGKVITEQGLVEIIGGYSPVISNTGALGRWDYVYLDNAGAVKIQEGVEATSPRVKPFYSRKVLALIKRGANRSDIKGGDIFGCKNEDRAEILSSTILVKDAGSTEVFFKDPDGNITVDMALRELWQKSVVLIGDRATALENGVVYKGSSQTLTGEKTFNILPKFLAAETAAVLVPSVDSHPITKKYYENTETGTGAVKVGTASAPSAQDIHGVKTFKQVPVTPGIDTGSGTFKLDQSVLIAASPQFANFGTIVLEDGVDIDSVKKPGFYRTANNNPHIPTSGSNGGMIVLRGSKDDSTIVQIGFSNATADLFAWRASTNSGTSWTSWKEIDQTLTKLSSPTFNNPTVTKLNSLSLTNATKGFSLQGGTMVGETNHLKLLTVLSNIILGAADTGQVTLKSNGANPTIIKGPDNGEVLLVAGTMATKEIYDLHVAQDVRAEASPTFVELSLANHAKVDEALTDIEAMLDQDVKSDSAVEFATVDTGQGANELYEMDQNVKTDSAVEFASVDTGQGAHELYDMDQDVKSTDSPAFVDLTVGTLNALTLVNATKSFTVKGGTTGNFKTLEMLSNGTLGAAGTGKITVKSADTGDSVIIGPALGKIATLVEGTMVTTAYISVRLVQDVRAEAEPIFASVSAPLNVQSGNEANILNKFAGGDAWLNYRGATSRITELKAGDGMGAGVLTNFRAAKVYNAVWNDIADFVTVDDDSNIEFGKAYTRKSVYGNDVVLTRKKGEASIGIASDTYGFGVGQIEGAKQIPFAIGGWVLAHVDKVYAFGTPLVAKKGGILTKSSFLNKIFKFSSILAVYDRVENEEEWNGLKVNGRNWVKVR